MQAQLAQQEQQKLIKVQATKYAQHQAAVAAAAAGLSESSSQPQQDNSLASASDFDAPTGVTAQAMLASHIANPGEESETSGRKRRRTVVDYVALNRQLEAEAAGISGHSGSQQVGSAANVALTFVTSVPTDAVGVHATSTVPNQSPDSPMDGAALTVERQFAPFEQPHEGDKLS